MSALHRRGSVMERQAAMLQQVEIMEAPQMAALESHATGRARPVWVHSKSQAPYLFRPWMNPCVPGEWPYDLQALRGTQDYEDIIDWFARKHPHLQREDFDTVDRELARCAGGRQISVHVKRDPEEYDLLLMFTLFGYPPTSGYPYAEVEAFEALHTTVPAIDRLWLTALVRTCPGRYEDRHLVR
ncbi:hypothetical protein ACFJIX_17170 [Roseateles sp. UC29_93]|uniref:hypothetical protein n=1 Tax=Roseateles sp. UC29_93 TaxID=3350177 RepID=UPI003673301F